MFCTFFIKLCCCACNSFYLCFVDFWISDCKTTSAVSEHRVVFVKSSNFLCKNVSFHTEFFSKCFQSLGIFCLNELIERRVKKTDCYRASFHSLDDFIEVFLLKRKDSLKVFLACFCCFRNDHLLECSKFWFIKEHVFCTAKTDTHCTKAECVFSVLWCITVSKNVESLNGFARSSCAYRCSTNFISPTKELFKVARNSSWFYSYLTFVYFTSCTVDCKESTLLVRFSVYNDCVGILEFNISTTTNTWSTHTASYYGCV